MTDYHILSLFPSLLIYQLFAPTLLRIVLGVIMLKFGWSKLTKHRGELTVLFEAIYLKPGNTFVWIFGLLEMIAGLFLFVGLLTQATAIFSAVVLAATLFLKKKQPQAFQSGPDFLFLCLIIALSLLLTGAGAAAFDLPL